MGGIKKLIVLDFITQNTYVLPYDTNAFEDALECIEAANIEYSLNLSLSNCQWMECEQPNIIVL
jgi:hypothetical protein